jgi:hypothetical protein
VVGLTSTIFMEDLAGVLGLMAQAEAQAEEEGILVVKMGTM